MSYQAPGKRYAYTGTRLCSHATKLARLIGRLALVEIRRARGARARACTGTSRSRRASSSGAPASRRSRRCGRPRRARRCCTAARARGRRRRARRLRCRRPCSARTRRSRRASSRRGCRRRSTRRSSSRPARFCTKRMSPIAPSRSSFDVVPSSWTRTSLPSAQRSNWSAKRAFVTRCTRSISASCSLSSIQSTIGRPPTGSSCLGTVSVSGCSRVA